MDIAVIIAKKKGNFNPWSGNSANFMIGKA
jgi:hypothetical protein